MKTSGTAPRLLLLTSATMVAFAGNSLLCRLALRDTQTGPVAFTLVRLCTGAAVLWVISHRRGSVTDGRANWTSAAALFVYMAAFSLAYVTLSAATGALLLFGAVQATMICAAFLRGERLNARQVAGFAAALAGLMVLLAPGVTAPPGPGAALMLIAGVAWGAYTLRGARAGDPTATSAGNFTRAVPLAAALALASLPTLHFDLRGVALGAASGAATSGLGYAVWYSVLPSLRATSAAVVQLSVPALAAMGGFIFLGESVTPRLVWCSVAILGGIALVVAGRRQAP